MRRLLPFAEERGFGVGIAQMWRTPTPKELDTDDKMPRPRIVRAFSAGGVVFRVTAADPQPAAHSPEASGMSSTGPGHPADDALASVEVVLVGFLRDNTWTLPKGTPAVGETVEETALREVREETGIQARIVGDLGSIQYSFARRGVRFNKEVRHFLMEATGGDVSLHDAEYDEARWFAFADAMRQLTYINEAEVVRRAQPLIGSRLAGGE
jgi:8-oxo-dGTP pyrophosphatase MutT (NUDIX family)